jgi:restriction endonuclease S subunit
MSKDSKIKELLKDFCSSRIDDAIQNHLMEIMTQENELKAKALPEEIAARFKGYEWLLDFIIQVKQRELCPKCGHKFPAIKIR